LGLLLKISIAVLIFGIGMSATASDVAYVWRRPALLGKSLLAMYIVVPLGAVLMARALDLPWGTKVALVVLAICAGAPLLPKKLVKLGGDPSYIFSLVVTTSLLAIVTVPAGLHVLSRYAVFESTVTPSQIGTTVLKAFLLPLGAGMLVRVLSPGVAERLGEPVLRVSSAALAVCAVVLLVAGFHLVIAVGLPSLFAFAAFTLIALGAGHVLGGPDRGTEPPWPWPVRPATSAWRCSLPRELSGAARPDARRRVPRGVGDGVDSLHSMAYEGRTCQ
jgi:predicted Na+-dependent transporter